MNNDRKMFMNLTLIWFAFTRPPLNVTNKCFFLTYRTKLIKMIDATKNNKNLFIGMMYESFLLTTLCVGSFAFFAIFLLLIVCLPLNVFPY